MSSIAEIIDKQRRFFEAGASRSIPFRKAALKNLSVAISNYGSEILQALADDLGKSAFESVATEISYVQSEITHTLKHLGRWSASESRSVGLASFPAKAKVIKDPYGITLHIAPWNYPFQLSLTPLVSAIAAGNTVVLKPSEYSEKTSQLLKRIVEEVFDPSHVSVVLGDAQTSTELLSHSWDYIFFTGSVGVGKIVAKAAAEHLTPCTLELGGKSPCVIDETAPLELTARRIVWGKLLNVGQTCIAPDYLLVHETVKEPLLKALVVQIEKAYGKSAIESEDYGRLIHPKHVARMKRFIGEATVYYGGVTDDEKCYVSPTILVDVTGDSSVMQEEIFGPVLPVISYTDSNEMDQWLRSHPNPLAFYVFSKNKSFAEKLLTTYSFGQAAVNDTIMMIAENSLPFGGVGNSGYGSYHGKYGFDTFSREKPVLYRATWLDLPLRYAPYKGKLKALKALLGINSRLS
ncbi:MAG: aldehyde dehydrogenase [Flavobacteriaceae bacterium]